MKKIDLENKVNELTEYISKQSENHKKEIVELTNKYKAFIEEKEEAEYKAWKETNGKFLERFIEETIKKNLELKLTPSYGGNVEAQLTYNNRGFNFESLSIITKNNGLEE